MPVISALDVDSRLTYPTIHRFPKMETGLFIVINILFRKKGIWQ